MNTITRFGPPIALAVLSALSGCASNPSCGDDRGNFDAVTICPGASRSCAAVPCTVYYLMPEGSGDYQVIGNGIDIGEFSAGEKVTLGAFWESYYFDIVGADIPRAYIFIGETP